LPDAFPKTRCLEEIPQIVGVQQANTSRGRQLFGALRVCVIGDDKSVIGPFMGLGGVSLLDRRITDRLRVPLALNHHPDAAFLRDNVGTLIARPLGHAGRPALSLHDLSKSVVDELWRRLERDRLVVEIMARNDGEPGYAAAVARSIAAKLAPGTLA
jgi:hypothetical protein